MKIRVDNLSKGSEPIYSCDSKTLTYKAGRMVKPKGARCHVQLLNINDKSLISIASNIKKRRDLNSRNSEAVIIIKENKIGLLCTGI